MNVVIYARYSSNRQDENTIEAQIRYCEEYCARNDYQVINTYIDRATSASHDIEKRTNFLKMVKDSEKHQFNGVVVFKLDRFARNRYDSATYKNRLKKNGVIVLSATENLSNDKESIILESVLEGMAEYFSKDLSEKVISGMREIAYKCEYNGGVVPFGYKIIDKHYCIDDNKATIVKELFERFAKGEPLIWICDDFNKRGLRNDKNKPFNKNSFHTLLQNDRYTGIYRFQDIVIENGIPAIIDKETFLACKKRMEEKKRVLTRTMKNEYLLSCKCYCDKCGEMLVGLSGTSKSGKRYYYYGHKSHKCSIKNINKESLETKVMDVMIDLLQEETIDKIADIIIQAVDKYNQTNDRVKLIQDQITSVERKINNVIEAIEMSNSMALINRLKALEIEKKALVKEETNAKKDRINLTKDQVLFYFDAMLKHKTDYSVQRQLATIIIDKVILKENNVVNIHFNFKLLPDSSDGVLIDNDDEYHYNLIRTQFQYDIYCYSYQLIQIVANDIKIGLPY